MKQLKSKFVGKLILNREPHRFLEQSAMVWSIWNSSEIAIKLVSSIHTLQ